MMIAKNGIGWNAVRVPILSISKIGAKKQSCRMGGTVFVGASAK
jgi:hypothetical protein